MLLLDDEDEDDDEDDDAFGLLPVPLVAPLAEPDPPPLLVVLDVPLLLEPESPPEPLLAESLLAESDLAAVAAAPLSEPLLRESVR
ncbi:hypothetical protein [Plantactinospora endophytica]|uniref:hypothetical protein n=1 Tax=Plantactinospora endophytica TaxID=673535 RepID=UPI001EF2E1F9|nr:hypothetical protein [Plantactinospora endophytica]